MTVALSFIVLLNGKEIPFSTSLTPNGEPIFVGENGELNGLSKEEYDVAFMIAKKINEAFHQIKPQIRGTQLTLPLPPTKMAG